MKFRIRTLVLSAAITSIAGTAVLNSSANAESLYHLRDPNATGCAQDARTVSSRSLAPGSVIELRYSPRCRTAWARVTGSPAEYANSAGVRAQIQRLEGGSWVTKASCSSNGSSCYTLMVDDAGRLARAWGWDDLGSRIVAGYTGSY